MKTIKKMNLLRRIVRVRKSIKSASSRLRLSVFRSNKGIYAQVIDDQKGITVVSSSDAQIKNRGTVAAARVVGLDLAAKLKKTKVKEFVFDRRGRAYHGRVKAVAEGAREGGLKF